MRKTIPLFFVLLALVLPATGLAQDGSGYLAIKSGLYSYEGDLDEEHAAGFNGEITYGHYIQHLLVLEGTAGYFHDGVSSGNDIRGYDLQISVKRTFDIGRYEPFIGAGVGVYFANYKGVLKEARNRVPMDVDDTVYGVHLLAGLNLNFHSSLFLGFEGKYIYTDDADFNGAKIDLDGLTTMAVLGYRF